MRLWPFAFALGLVPAAMTPALAGQDGGTVYIGVRAVGSAAAIGDVSTTAFTGTTLVENDTDLVAGIAGIVGYSFDKVPLRAELEVGYRFRFDFDVRDVAAQTIDYEMNIATTSALLNTIVEWRNDSDFTPFVGATVGWARNSTDTQRTNLTTQAQVNRETDVDNLAWGGMAGVDWDFGEEWAAQLAYRYINLGDVDTGALNTTDSITGDDYVSHDVLLSILFRF
jgi:opacity protein-like surface antigen